MMREMREMRREMISVISSLDWYTDIILIIDTSELKGGVPYSLDIFNLNYIYIYIDNEAGWIDRGGSEDS